jgi:Ca2+/Na+ antiporter
MSNIFDMEIEAMGGLSYQERTLWGSLVAELVVYLPYFFFHHQNSVGKVAGMIFAIIALQIVLQAIIAVITRQRIRDERDRLIQLRGYRAGYLTFVSLMLLGLAMLWLHANAHGGDLPANGHMMALHFLNVFYGILVISDIVKTVAQIVAYRRGL